MDDKCSFIRNFSEKVHSLYHDGSWESCDDVLCVEAKNWILKNTKNTNGKIKKWKTRDGKEILIDQMDDQYLKNAIKYVTKKASRIVYEFKKIDDNIKSSDIVDHHFPILNVLKNELLKRSSKSQNFDVGIRKLDL